MLLIIISNEINIPSIQRRRPNRGCRKSRNSGSSLRNRNTKMFKEMWYDCQLENYPLETKRRGVFPDIFQRGYNLYQLCVDHPTTFNNEQKPYRSSKIQRVL